LLSIAPLPRCRRRCRRRSSRCWARCSGSSRSSCPPPSRRWSTACPPPAPRHPAQNTSNTKPFSSINHHAFKCAQPIAGAALYAETRKVACEVRAARRGGSADWRCTQYTQAGLRTGTLLDVYQARSTQLPVSPR